MRRFRDLFPFIPDHRELRVEEAALVFSSPEEAGGACEASQQCPCPEPKVHDCYEVKLTAAEWVDDGPERDGRHEHRGWHGHNGRSERGHDGREWPRQGGEHGHREGYLHCRADAQLQHLYVGRLRERLGELGRTPAGLQVRLHFEREVGWLERAYVLFRYSVRTHEPKPHDPCRLRASM
jgi:hypothetical protein